MSKLLLSVLFYDLTLTTLTPLWLGKLLNIFNPKMNGLSRMNFIHMKAESQKIFWGSCMCHAISI